MNNHEKSLKIFSAYNLTNKKTGEILGCSAAAVNAKKNLINANQFTLKNYLALQEYADKVCEQNNKLKNK